MYKTLVWLTTGCHSLFQHILLAKICLHTYTPTSKRTMNEKKMKKLDKWITCGSDPIAKTTFNWPKWRPENGSTMGM